MIMQTYQLSFYFFIYYNHLLCVSINLSDIMQGNEQDSRIWPRKRTLGRWFKTLCLKCYRHFDSVFFVSFVPFCSSFTLIVCFRTKLFRPKFPCCNKKEGQWGRFQSDRWPWPSPSSSSSSSFSSSSSRLSQSMLQKPGGPQSYSQRWRRTLSGT